MKRKENTKTKKNESFSPQKLSKNQSQGNNLSHSNIENDKFLNKTPNNLLKNLNHLNSPLPSPSEFRDLDSNYNQSFREQSQRNESNKKISKHENTPKSTPKHSNSIKNIFFPQQNNIPSPRVMAPKRIFSVSVDDTEKWEWEGDFLQPITPTFIQNKTQNNSTINKRNSNSTLSSNLSNQKTIDLSFESNSNYSNYSSNTKSSKSSSESNNKDLNPINKLNNHKNSLISTADMLKKRQENLYLELINKNAKENNQRDKQHQQKFHVYNLEDQDIENKESDQNLDELQRLRKENKKLLKLIHKLKNNSIENNDIHLGNEKNENKRLNNNPIKMNNNNINSPISLHLNSVIDSPKTDSSFDSLDSIDNSELIRKRKKFAEALKKKEEETIQTIKSLKEESVEMEKCTSSIQDALLDFVEKQAELSQENSLLKEKINKLTNKNQLAQEELSLLQSKFDDLILQRDYYIKIAKEAQNKLNQVSSKSTISNDQNIVDKQKLNKLEKDYKDLQLEADMLKDAYKKLADEHESLKKKHSFNIQSEFEFT